MENQEQSMSDGETYQNATPGHVLALLSVHLAYGTIQLSYKTSIAFASRDLISKKTNYHILVVFTRSSRRTGGQRL